MPKSSPLSTDTGNRPPGRREKRSVSVFRIADFQLEGAIKFLWMGIDPVKNPCQYALDVTELAG